MRLKVPEALRPLFTKKKRFKVAIGGRGSGKSTGIADAMILNSITEGAKIGCFREFQNSINDSVYSLLKGEIERHEQDGRFDVQAQNIYSPTGGVFTFKGLARNPHSIKSMFGYKYFWCEEAQTLSEESLKLLTPTLREADSELWFSANPQSSADPFSQRFITPFKKELDKNGFYEDDLHIIVVCNYTDNPFFPEELEQERAWDEQHLSRAMYRHIWLGDFNDEVENSIIPVDWFDSALDAHIKKGFKPEGVKVASHDPSDLGNDAKGFCIRHGSVFTAIKAKDDGDVNEGCDWALQQAIQTGCDYFTWDCDGLGVSLKRDITNALDGKKITSVMFKGSEGVEHPEAVYQPTDKGEIQKARTNKETFRNKRAQYYWRLRDRFYNTYRAVVHGDYVNPDDMISINTATVSDIDQLRAEVCRIPIKPNANGYIQIMSKEDMKRLNIASPNMADSLMMSMMIPNTNRKTVYIPRSIHSIGAKR